MPKITVTVMDENAPDPPRVGIHHRGRVESPDPPGGVDLPGEALTEMLGPGMHGMDQLDRDPAAARRDPQEHLAHTASPQPAYQLVAAHASRITALKTLHHRPDPPHPLPEQTARTAALTQQHIQRTTTAPPDQHEYRLTVRR